jgi:uncharacterized protein (DUF885 family)
MNDATLHGGTTYSWPSPPSWTGCRPSSASPWATPPTSRGWGLDAERLAAEMGLYSDDLERIGMLAADSWRSCRLVVDTGLHALGWGRREAIDFMAANAPVSLGEIEVEVDRYIGMPGQALAYKIGQREIFRLREQARQALGARFDIKAFHDVVLGSSSVSLPVLRELVGTWAGTA